MGQSFSYENNDESNNIMLEIQDTQVREIREFNTHFEIFEINSHNQPYPNFFKLYKKGSWEDSLSILKESITNMQKVSFYYNPLDKVIYNVQGLTVLDVDGIDCNGNLYVIKKNEETKTVNLN